MCHHFSDYDGEELLKSRLSTMPLSHLLLNELVTIEGFTQ